MDKYDAEKSSFYHVAVRKYGDVLIFTAVSVSEEVFFFEVEIQCAENSDCLLPDSVSGIEVYHYTRNILSAP